MSTFIVKRENDSESNSRTLHRNLLLSIGSLLLATECEIDKISEIDVNIVQSQNEGSAELIEQDIDQGDVNSEDSNVESDDESSINIVITRHVEKNKMILKKTKMSPHLMLNLKILQLHKLN